MGKIYTVDIRVSSYVFKHFATTIFISWNHNDSDNSFLDTTNITTVGRVIPENYTLSHNRAYTFLLSQATHHIPLSESSKVKCITTI